MPDTVKSLCRLAEIQSKSLLVQVARQPDEKAMVQFVERIVLAGGITRAEARRATAGKSRGRSKPYVFKYAAPSKAFRLQLNFRKAKVGKAELIRTLEGVIKDLRSG